MSMDSGLSGQTAKLPVIVTLRSAYALVFGNLGVLIALAAIPFAISIAGRSLVVPPRLIVGFVENSGGGPAVQLAFLIGVLLVGVVAAVVPWIVFVIAWHRFVLLGKRDTRRPLEYYFGLREANFFRNDLFLCWFLAAFTIIYCIIVFSILVYPKNFPPAWEPVIFLTLFLIAMVRFLFTDPAMAVGHETDLRMSWKQSRGVGWSLFWIVFMAAIPFDLLYHFFGTLGARVSAGIALASQQYVTDLLFAIAQRLVLFFGTAVFVTALCLSYQHVVGESARPKAEATNIFACFRELILTLILGLVAGGVGYWIAEALTLPAKEQHVLTAAAFLIPLIWTIHRTKN